MSTFEPSRSHSPRQVPSGEDSVAQAEETAKRDTSQHRILAGVGFTDEMMVTFAHNTNPSASAGRGQTGDFTTKFGIT